MTIAALDHFTIRVSDLEVSRRFYVEVLGLSDGARPPFGSPGAWLYGGAAPIVHLVVGDTPSERATGALDHVAFRAEGLADVVANLKAHDVPHSLRTVPGLGLRQIFLDDPDGVRLELNFAADERLPGEARGGTAP